MKLLVNMCAQDGIVSHNSGVGTMAKRYIYALMSLFEKNGVDYHINLFTPEYDRNAYGYSLTTEEENKALDNVTIYELPNGSNRELFFGFLENWQAISKNITEVINSIDFSEYDYVLTLAHDTPFAGVIENAKEGERHYKIWIPHSTAKIHNTEERIQNDPKVIERIKWELEGVEYINNHDNCFLAVIGDYIKEHMINEYNLRPEKALSIYNGEVLSKKTKYEENKECETLYKNMNKKGDIMLSFGRPEEYKNLDATMKLGKKMHMRNIVAVQQYYDDMPYVNYLKELAKDTNTELYIDKPFNFPQYILNRYPNRIILVVPSKREIAGLIINEIRKFNKDNILLVSNNIDGLKEQIEDGVDGILVDLDNIDASSEKIKNNIDNIAIMNKNAQKTLHERYDFEKNLEIFLIELLNINIKG